MEEHYLTEQRIGAFAAALCQAERSKATVEKYLRSVRRFAAFLAGAPVTKQTVVAWKEQLQKKDGCSPSTVNASLAALNGLFQVLGWTECRARYLKIQRRLFRDAGRELRRGDYEKLLSAAGGMGREKIALIMETICAAGIRVSELRYVTVEAARAGQATVSLKGKIRTILLPGKLCRKLLNYAKRQKTASGEIFLTGSGKPIGRSRVWKEMKRLCGAAGVEPSRVFPHNLRRLFATAYYRVYRDLVKLADILGHSSIETTRIYLLTTGQEHRRQLEGLRLVR